MKYIFVTGAPGSKWSSVVKNIYYSPDIDRTDYSDSRTYYHTATGSRQLMHMGAYFDPGMEFGDWFDSLDQYSPEQCAAEFDRPFSGTGVRIIKSHVFAHHINYLKKHWPESPVILVSRSDDACLGWWVKCGQFDITYPLYHNYYKNLQEMSVQIQRQNADIQQAWNQHHSKVYHNIENNFQLAETCDIRPPVADYYQNYTESDIKVKIL
jgi:hypothetical protein